VPDGVTSFTITCRIDDGTGRCTDDAYVDKSCTITVCNDLDPCTDDICVNNVCQYPPGWVYSPLGSNSGDHSFDPPAQGNSVCPGTVLSILGDIQDTDTWTGSREPCPKTLTVSVTANLSGPEGINETWPPAVGTASAPPSPLSASASLTENYTLCTPGEYTLTFSFTEDSPADDPGFPTPVEPFTFTVPEPEVSVTIEDVVCCPGCAYQLQINVTNDGDCDAQYHWELTGSGDALASPPFSPWPATGTRTVPAHQTVPIEDVRVRTDPNATDGASADIEITLTGPGDCPAQGASASATVTVHRPDLTVAGVSEILEDTLGASVALNVDDDDHNDAPDLGQTYVPGENDLIAVTISANGLPACGTLTLSVSGAVALWATQEKGTPVTTLTWPAASPPPTLWLEGTEASGSPRNVVLTLTYNGDACDPPTCECSDTVLLTVMHVEIHIDGPTTPGGGTLLGVGELAAMTLTQTPPTFDCADLALTWDDDPQTRKVRLYDSLEKTTEYTSALVWGAGSSPPPVYVEAVAPSETLGDIVFTLTWLCDDSNPTTMIATGRTTQVQVDLDIWNGQYATGAQELDEVKEDNPGAFTVANLNDTDNNGHPDVEDTVVNGTPPNGRPEVDLMKLVLRKPQPDLGDNVTLSVTGPAKLWEQSTKVTEVELSSGIVQFSTSQLDKTLWVEITSPSQSLRDVTLQLSYQGFSDTVKATGIWVTEADVAVKSDIASTNWADMTDPPKNMIDRYGGFGCRPVSTNYGIRNVIGFRFQLRPVGVGALTANVRVDVGRQKEGRSWFQLPNASWSANEPDVFPDNNEDANDDDLDTDESQSSSQPEDAFFSEDSPGWPFAQTDGYLTYVHRRNFYEFLRVAFTERPSGDGIHGSRCSDRIKWHSRMRAVDSSGTWARTTQAGENLIGTGHKDVGTDPEVTPP
jgi:hypothetical protein